MKSESFRADAHKKSSSQGTSPLLTIGNAAIFPRHLVGTLALVTCGVLVVVAKSNGAQSSPTPATATAATKANATATSATKANTTKSNINPTGRGVQAPITADTAPTVESAGVAPVLGDDGRRPIEFYTQTVRGGLFNAPEPPQPKPVVVQPPKKEVKEQPVVVVIPDENPFEKWIYTGTINQGGQVTALVENLETKEGRFIKLGDEMLGARATVVDETHVMFTIGKKKPYELGKSANMSMTPLDRTAIPTTAQQAQQPQTPGQPQPVVITPSAPATTGFTLPNGMQLTPDQMQRRMQRMNRNFNQ